MQNLQSKRSKSLGRQKPESTQKYESDHFQLENNPAYLNFRPSPNALKNIKYKKDNPFWMPSKNEELFEVRDILRQKKELKKVINRNKSKKNKGLNEYDQEQFLDNNPNTYLTETGQKNVNDFIKKYQNIINSIETENDPSNACVKVLQNFEELKNKESEKLKTGDNNSLVQKKIDTLGYKKKQNIREYINKTRELVLMKYSINVKKECAVRLQETYNNEVESIKDSIFSMEEAQKLFENEFYIKFEQYLKTLIKQKEKEKTEENNLREEKMKLEREKKNILLKISNFEKEKAKYEEYLQFMIMVKEKILEIPPQAKSDSLCVITNESILNMMLESKTPLSRTSAFYVGSRSSVKAHSKRVSTNLAMGNIKRELIDRIRGYYNGVKLFSHPQDLLGEIKKMENDNLNRLAEYNKLMHILNEDEKELERIIEEDKKIHVNNIADIELKEKQLKDLKEKHKSFNEEKKNLILENKDSYKNNSHSHQNRRSSFNSNTKNKYSDPQLFAKVVEVFNSTKELETNYEVIDLIKKNQIDVELNMLTMLKVIEKTVDFLNTKYNGFKLSCSDYLKAIEKELDILRKIQKCNDMKEQHEIEQARKRKENEERNNRIYIIPKRKTLDRCPPKNLGDKEKKNDQNDQKELNFEDFIFY